MSESAIRIDRATGIEERLEHIPTPRGLLYSSIARPQKTDRCVLICTSILGDFAANYHRERLLGRALSAHGIGVIRFHYAGEGNSQGDRINMTFSSLCDDANALLDHGRSIGFTNFAVLGTRLGALVAAATVASTTTVPLVLWEPQIDPLRLITDAHRARRISQVSQDLSGHGSDWRQELEVNGVLDLLGYDAYPPLIESLRYIDLLSALGSVPRSVFIARFRGNDELIDRFVETLVERGFPVTSRNFRLSESWSFQSERAPDSADLVPITTAWLISALAVAR